MSVFLHYRKSAYRKQEKRHITHTIHKLILEQFINVSIGLVKKEKEKGGIKKEIYLC